MEKQPAEVAAFFKSTGAAVSVLSRFSAISHQAAGQKQCNVWWQNLVRAASVSDPHVGLGDTPPIS